LATTTHPGLHDADFSGFYVMASYFLTGENRNYDVKKGAFSRVKPLKNFSPKAKTWGAWELATRYSIVDLDANRPINGRDLEDVTMGLNWYWNPNMRVMFNYIHTELNSQTHPKDELLFGDANIFAVRFQFDF
jgi:phosphate-selective porin OprO/OprP